MHRLVLLTSVCPPLKHDGGPVNRLSRCLKAFGGPLTRRSRCPKPLSVPLSRGSRCSKPLGGPLARRFRYPKTLWRSPHAAVPQRTTALRDVSFSYTARILQPFLPSSTRIGLSAGAVVVVTVCVRVWLVHSSKKRSGHGNINTSNATVTKQTSTGLIAGIRSTQQASSAKKGVLSR